MTDLYYRQQKIEEKRKKTPRREFVMEIASWCPVNLYKVDGKISRYPSSPRMGTLVSSHEFVDASDGIRPYVDCDHTTEFFAGLDDLRKKIEKPRIWTFGNIENSDFSDTIGYGSKNCYLTICAGEDIENVLYSFFVITKCINVINCLGVTDGCTNIYTSVGIAKSYNIFYSRYIYNSTDIWFSSNLQGCRHCLFCDNLANQSYCIKNMQYSKEEYIAQKALLLAQKSNFDHWLHEVNIDSVNIGSEQCSGMNVLNSHNVENGILVNQVRDGRNLIIYGSGADVTNSYDSLCSAMFSDHAFANMGVSPGSFMYCSMNSGYLDHVYYSVYCQKCAYCLGCFGLANKKYCIYNKQYTEKEWFAEVEKIFAAMYKNGTLGNYFPGPLNPFYFNDTVAYLIDPTFTKEEVEAKGYLRRDEPIKVDIPEWMETVRVDELNQYEKFTDGARSIDSTILKKVIIDTEGNSYRIVKLEYDFLMKYELPIPRTHWLERMKKNFRTSS